MRDSDGASSSLTLDQLKCRVKEMREKHGFEYLNDDDIPPLNLIDALRRLESGDTRFPISWNETESASESVLESYFWHRVRKSSRGPFDEIVPQFKVMGYRCDSMFRIGDRRIVIELDGASFHEPEADIKRDNAILSSSQVDEIIRIPFAAMWYHDRSTLHVLGSWHSEFDCVRSGKMSLCDARTYVRSVECGDDSSAQWFSSFREWYTDWLKSQSLWNVTGDSLGFAGPAGAFFEQWKCSPITRQLRVQSGETQ